MSPSVWSWIIPARAGFTQRHREAGRRPGDHPRSRGVYDHAILANHARARIIPARAGFTPRGPLLRSRPGDHPRSRGVYYVTRTYVTRTTRIIPARAGFTTPRRERRGRRWDHPRSRGVYEVCYSRMHITAGSSPLARGLPPREVCYSRMHRIIPARAGFTRPWPPPRRRRADHPRSRGVYSSPASMRTPTRGSSPLARGLPCTDTNHAAGARIIPARAGFTPLLPLTGALARDHPRSRGVY